MLGKMLGGEIKEGETALQELDADLTAAEAKVVPFLTKVTPVAEAVVNEFVTLSPTLKGVVTPTEIADFAAGIAAIPGLLAAMHTRIAELEDKLKNI
jgi:ubiquinone biosynthesis protein UbiJ